jgi:bacillithiol system protein YtxJ
MQILKCSDDWTGVGSLPTAVVYKHSSACPVSAGAIRQMQRFAEANPDVPISVIDVLTDRELSQSVAADLGVRHQSPQVILLRDGEVAWHASHSAVTALGLERAICVSQFHGNPEDLETACGPGAGPTVPFFTIPRWVLYGALALAVVAVLRSPKGGEAALLMLGIGAGVYLLGKTRG